jgi:hypothetical protein
MTSNPTEHLPIPELVALLANISEGIDPEFDNTYEELEREFAATRLTFDHI